MSYFSDYLKTNTATQQPCSLMSQAQDKVVCNILAFSVCDQRQDLATTVKIDNAATPQLVKSDSKNASKVSRINDILNQSHDGVLELLASKMGEHIEGTSQSLVFTCDMEGGCEDFSHAEIQFRCGSYSADYTQKELSMLTPWLKVSFDNKQTKSDGILPFSSFFPDLKKNGHIIAKSCGMTAQADGTSVTTRKIKLTVYRKLTYELKIKIPPIFKQEAYLEHKRSLNKLVKTNEVSSRFMSDTTSVKTETEESHSSRSVSIEIEKGGMSTKAKSEIEYKQGVVKKVDEYEVEYEGTKLKVEVSKVEGPQMRSANVKTTYETGLIYAKSENSITQTHYKDLRGNSVDFNVGFQYREIGQKDNTQSMLDSVKENEFVQEAASVANDCIEFKINGETPKSISFINALYNLKKDIKKFVNDIQGLVPAVGFKVTFEFTLLDGELTGTWGKRHDDYFASYPHLVVVEDFWDLEFATTLFGFKLEVFCGLDIQLDSPSLLSVFTSVNTLFALKAGVSLAVEYAFKIKGKLAKNKQDIEYPNLISETTVTLTAELKLILLDTAASVRVEVKWVMGEKFFFEKTGENGQTYFSIEGVKWYPSKKALIDELNKIELTSEINGNTSTTSFDASKIKKKLANGESDPNPDGYPKIAGAIQPQECTIEFVKENQFTGTQDTKPQKAMHKIVLAQAHETPIWEGGILG